MYGDRCTMAWINGLKSFLDAAEAQKSSKVSCVVHAAFAKIKRNTLKETLYTSTFMKRVSWITTLFGPSTVNLEF